MTVTRRIELFYNRAKLDHKIYLSEVKCKSDYSLDRIQFDELITFEHTKLKPLAVAMAVDQRTRMILGFEVSTMPANGVLAERSRLKYGFRKDRRVAGLRKMLENILPVVSESATFVSDECPFYPKQVKAVFPKGKHIVYKGRESAETGQGELKKGIYDPMFSVNHTFAMIRANTARLIRKTWCTTKNKKHLEMHLEIYVQFHNRVALNRYRRLTLH